MRYYPIVQWDIIVIFDQPFIANTQLFHEETPTYLRKIYM